MTFTSFVLKTCEYLTPFSTLTYLASKLTEKDLGGFTRFLINNFIKTFNINTDEILEEDLSKYKTFNEFFIRKVKPETRPINLDCKAISPVDGTIGEAGVISHGRLIQAKGLDYSLCALLGGNKADSDIYENGNFATIYLSPANYHRIHMPCDGTLVKTVHVPGKLFPVGSRNISNMPNLYTVNERLVCFFDTDVGPMAVVMVGAALVGSINTTWGGTVVRRKGIETLNYDGDNQYKFKRGDEIGYFKYGSTVIVLWAKDHGQLAEDLEHLTEVKFGRSLIVEKKD